MRYFTLLIAVTLAIGLFVTTAVAAERNTETEFFERHIRPLFVEHCHECHSGRTNEPDAHLRLDSRAAVLAGGDRGPAVAPGDVSHSRLVRAISYEDVELQMPPDGKLPDEAIALLTEWVRGGAVWPDEPAETSGGSTPAPVFDLAERKRAHWAWRPIAPTTTPEVGDSSWPRGDADRFILARLEQAGIRPAEPADRRTWLRRVTFDLIGLPPTVEEIVAFLADESDDAYERVVDRLLESPHFGERWARHWLDLVRYAETKGHEFDYPAPNAWQYRDYVIRALNADVPYDRFVTEHVAGDLLAEPRLNASEGFNESIIGPGFWFLGEELHSPVDTRQDEADRFDNRLDVMTKTFLGLTVSCTRCHDHKFDAITSRDYYALFGFLSSSGFRLARFDTLEHDGQLARELDAVRCQARAPLRRAVAEAVRPVVNQLNDYLFAARDVLLAGPEENKRIAECAEARSLDPGVLAAWVAHLRGPAVDSGDLLHLWRGVSDAVFDRPARLAEVLADWKASQPAVCDVELKNFAELDVIVDYRHLASGEWLPDDVSYGLGPRLAGDVTVSGTLDAPRLRFVERPAAEFDRAWEVRTLAAGSQLEPAAVGDAARPGRTLTTPHFAVRGKLFYLVRGAGQCYAAVDQHLLIKGPLHGVLLASFDTEGQWRWIERDLTDYVGRVGHLEFTPAKDAEFAIAAVVQAEQAPALPGAGYGLLVAPDADESATIEAVAAAYQRRFAALLDRLTMDPITELPGAGSPASSGDLLCAEDARLANWALDHPALFGGSAGWEAIAGEQLAAEAGIIARITRESRLCATMLDGTGVDERVFVRGSPKSLGDAAPRRFLEALAGPAPLDTGLGSGRLELARQMTDPAIDPFLPRVIVNRVWRHLFGRGIVASVDNFGVMGDAPTHPELLDHLASRFVADGWSIKRLIRTLTLSSAYRMGSRGEDESEALDPQNLLLHRTHVRRLEGEAIRDAMLAISGRLEQRMYGPSVPVYLTEFMEGRGRPETSGPLDGDGRRSIYIAVRRNFLPPMMLAFDTPIPFSTIGRRSVSNVPAQSLVMLNDPLVHELAERWAARICEGASGMDERIEGMYLAAFGRPPSDVERRACVAFLGKQDELLAWKNLAHALWNVKEFVFVE